MRIVRRWPYAAAAALACAACAPAPTVRRLDQPFTNIEICRLEENRLPGRAGLRFDLERADTGQVGPPVYTVLLRAVGARPIPVRPTAPLRLSVGADSLVLLPADSTVRRSVLHAELLSTSIRYVVELEALRRVGDADDVRLAAVGPFGGVGARLSSENLDGVRRFLADCTAERPLPPPPDSSAAGPSGRGPGD
jgi:hypothetical protein